MVLMNLSAGQQWRCRRREHTCGHRVGRIERVALKHIHYRMKNREPLETYTGSLNPMLCDNPEGWEGMGDGKEV